jgi:nucleotide-binding universal stress UspA family protein
MFKNILIPTDGSALSHRAIKDAVRLAKTLHAQVTGFYVAPTYHIEVYTDYVPPNLINPKEHAANAKKTAQRHLDYVKKIASNSKVKCAGYYVMSDLTADARQILTTRSLLHL